MAKKLKTSWLDQAIDDLEAEVKHITADHPKAAKNFIKQVKRQVELLQLHPHMGRAGRILGTRELVITNFPYIVSYRVKIEIIEILAIFHEARQYPP